MLENSVHLLVLRPRQILENVKVLFSEPLQEIEQTRNSPFCLLVSEVYL